MRLMKAMRRSKSVQSHPARFALKIRPGELRQGAERYRQQAEIYTQAANQSLRREVAAFKVIFLRTGEAIEIVTERNKELMLF